MHELLRRGYKAKKRPSGHDISEKFAINNGGAIPPNLIALPNTESNGLYLRYCQKQGLNPHPARFPAELPEFFVRMLTNKGDLVVDPFGGSCVTGEVCERLDRKWVCIDLVQDYLKGAVGRFKMPSAPRTSVTKANRKGKVSKAPSMSGDKGCYRLPAPGALWNGPPNDQLPIDGGRQRHAKAKATTISSGKPVAKRNKAARVAA
jgi:site-specific DNA-methyltransferase (cytosine-N4-specific)